jgi:hypothetical protein
VVVLADMAGIILDFSWWIRNGRQPCSDGD